MNITSEISPNREAVLTVEVEPERLQSALKRAAQHISRVRPLAGFRPGKAPYAMVERAVGKDLLLDEAIDELSREVLVDALNEQKLDPQDVGKFEVTQKDPPIFKYTLPLRPEVKLGDYSTLHLQPDAPEVTDAEVDAVLNRLQSNQATLAPVTREVRKGDTVTLDLSGGVEGREPEVEQGAQFVLGDPSRPGLLFEDQVIGMQPGETRTVTFAYPEDFSNQELRGKTATYQVTVQDIKETQMPALDDEFAKSVSAFQSLDQFKGNIRNILRSQKERDIENKFADQVVDAVSDLSELAYHSSMVDSEVAHQLEHLQESVKAAGLAWPKYLELTGKTEDEAKTELRPAAEKSLRRTLTLLELVKQMNPPVSQKDIDDEIQRRVEMAQEAGENGHTVRRALTTRQARADLEFNLRVRETMNKLIAMVKGEATTGRILTPDMVRAEAGQQQGQGPAAGRSPSGLITDPSQVRPEDWPKGIA